MWGKGGNQECCFDLSRNTKKGASYSSLMMREDSRLKKTHLEKLAHTEYLTPWDWVTVHTESIQTERRREASTEPAVLLCWAEIG